MATITSRLHFYRFQLSLSYQEKQYQELRQFLLESRLAPLLLPPEASRVDYAPSCDADGTIHLETRPLLNRRWLTTAGAIAHDWMELHTPGSTSRTGYYLDLTTKMQALRRNTLLCGRCREQYGDSTNPLPTPLFCPECLSDPALTPPQYASISLAPVNVEEHQRLVTDQELSLIEDIRSRKMRVTRKKDSRLLC